MCYQLYLTIGERESVLVCTCDSFQHLTGHALSIMRTLTYCNVSSYTLEGYFVCLDNPSENNKLVFTYEK